MTSADHPLLQLIRTRRSVRAYRAGAEVTRQQLEAIVDCGRLAPSANNLQSWEFVVVTDREKLQKLSELATYGRFIRDAAACIVVCGDLKANRSLYIDGAAATENMMLAAHALGLCSCWVQGYDKPYNEGIRHLLGVPDSHVLVSIFPVAVPERETKMPQKRALAEVLHWEKF
jgi:nitroreductase